VLWRHNSERCQVNNRPSTTSHTRAGDTCCQLLKKLVHTHIYIYMYIYLFTYSMVQSLLEKLTGLQLVKKFPAFHGTTRFITTLTSVRHLSLSWASLIQSIPPHPTYWRCILILPSHLRLGLTSGLFPSGFPTKTLYNLLSSPIHATCRAHLILLYFIIRTILGEQYRSFSSLYIQGVPGGKDLTSGECSLGQTITI